MYIILRYAQDNYMKKLNKAKIFKFLDMLTFGILMIGGLNFLVMGLFSFDIFGGIFGGPHAVVSRIFYSLFGLSALYLLLSILWKAFMHKKAPAHKTQSASTNA